MSRIIEFLFPRRLARLPYLLRALVLNALLFFLYPEALMDIGGNILGWLLIVGYMSFFIILPRIRDIGMSAWWIILAFIPYIEVFLSIVLLFRRSNPRLNPLLQRLAPLDPSAVAPAADGQDKPPS